MISKITRRLSWNPDYSRVCIKNEIEKHRHRVYQKQLTMLGCILNKYQLKMNEFNIPIIIINPNQLNRQFWEIVKIVK